MKAVLALLALFLMSLGTVNAQAIDFDADISDEDKAAFEGILAPIMKIYNFIKFAATALAAIFLVMAGVSFIANGGDPSKRENAKMMITYIVVGLVVIWVAPLVVNFLVV